MKKIIPLMLLTILITSLFSPVYSSDYSQSALDYLSEEYAVDQEQIEVYDGGIAEFDYTGESFWMGRYVIAPAGDVAPRQREGNEERPIPDAERFPEQGPAIMPLPADNLPEVGTDTTDYIYGGIYIRIKNGEILNDSQMEPYFAAEGELAQQEWERLQKEAGKLDVSLYRRLQTVSPTEKISVFIQPTAVETDEAKARFQELKERFPQFTENMELTDLLDGGRATILPALYSRGDDTPVIDGEILPIGPDEESLQEYSAYWEEVEEIRILAYAMSMDDIVKILSDMGIDYTENHLSISAELTAEQIQEIAESAAVSAIYEDGGFSTLEGETMQLRTGVDDASPAMALDADSDEGQGGSPVLVFAIAGLLAASIIFIYLKKRKALV